MKQFDIPSSKLLLLFFLITVSISAIDITRIPLTYAFGSDMITKLPIEISFNHSNVYSTSLTNHLFLLKYNLSVAVESFPRKPESNKIEIGLKYPSNFISAMAASFKVSYDSVQFGKSQYLEVILFDDNYVQNRDYFYNEDSYKVHVKYNFGDDMMIDDKPCKLIDGSIIYFQEYLIRQALNKMTKQNLINFKFHQDNHTVQLFGKLQNLPKLTLVRGDFIFKMKIQGDIIHYLPAIDNIDRHTLIGYHLNCSTC